VTGFHSAVIMASAVIPQRTATAYEGGDVAGREPSCYKPGWLGFAEKEIRVTLKAATGELTDLLWDFAVTYFS
jgi:hypothetical protein